MFLRRVGKVSIQMIGLFLIWPFLVSAQERGSGVFGTWITDRFGLPAYEYTLDELTDPRGEWDPRIAPKTRLMWFPLGNQRIVAASFNHGFVQLFYNESGTRWINLFEPESLDYAGGFGFILEHGKAFSTLYSRRPESAGFRRIFGMGYFEKIITFSELKIDQVVYAPALDLPVLISEVRLTNLSDRMRSFSYFEYWDVNLHDTLIIIQVPVRGLWKRPYTLTPRWLEEQRMLVAESNKVWGQDGGFPDKPRFYDPEQPSIFLAALEGEVSGYEFDQNEIFSQEHGWLAGPGALERISSRPLDKGLKENHDNCLVLRQEVSLGPKQEKTLRFVFGYAKAVKPQDVLSRIKAPEGLLERTTASWRKDVPRFQAQPENYLSREVQWDYYCLKALTLIDGYYKIPFVPQGGNYLFAWGMHGATRDFAAFAQSLAYYDPDLARNQLRLILRGQDPDGRLFYEMTGYGKKNYWIFRPSDLDLWLIWAVTDYVLTTRDFEFLDEEVLFYPADAGMSAPVYEHIQRALDHLINKVGTGKHGLIRLKLSDWNDEMTLLAAHNNLLDTIATIYRGESTMNTAMACLILPQFAAIAEARGDLAYAQQAREWTDQLIPVLQAQWREPGWLNRAYSGQGVEYGEKEFFLEPQVWALLAGNVLTPEQEGVLIANMKKHLIEPSAIGMMISKSREGSLTTRPGEQEEGGVWFAINGPGIVALSMHEKELAYEQLLRNSLTWHADTYPESWIGIWSGPDAFNSVYSDRPDQTWYLDNPVAPTGPQGYPVMNAHSHAQILYALARLAGLEGTIDGYIIDPGIPADSFSFQARTASVEREKDCLKGSFVFQAHGEITVKVRIPDHWQGKAIEVRVNGARADANFREGFLQFPLRHQRHIPATWKIALINN